MNRRAVLLGTSAAALAVFGGGAWYLRQQEEAAAAAAVTQNPEALVRPNSPILGPAEAPVTLVEFFDPSCEACRAFHPVIEDLRQQYPTQLRIVLRYTPFHEGSDEAVRILEAARRQDKFEPVLDALFEKQPEWAIHGAPDLDRAWRIAGAVGLDLERAQSDRLHPDTTAILNQDVADLQELGVRATPTFFLNGRPLTNLNFDALRAAVGHAVAETS
ncbi:MULTISPECIES: DsbA family protein [Paracoccus]|jgi:protein-disulfide isomerase|uniref:Protein-disulfide isomerase n=3 Tax=Paracoccus TaxID=265 RepID=A0A1G5JN60_9RHOB|nr:MULTISPECIES: thioredoxin domain-containing protein [Paracoccus]WCR01312.1 thioredoxin domain-containing protein [Paracoccus aestuarii]SCY89757.1 Protein-disulfide isomerase [Paracoccus tibetensis]